MPTLSFKDRGAAVLIAMAQQLGVKKVLQDSSGNAGVAIAAYAARAGMACDIYVPQAASPRKVQQIRSHGARVVVVAGDREETARAALDAAGQGEGFYASHVYQPWFLEGTKTFAYEIAEQLDWEPPEDLYLPLGNGTMVLGAFYGFRELSDAGLIRRMPRIIAVQAEGCAPIYRAYAGGTEVQPVRNTGTAAHGIAIAHPLRGAQALAAVRETGGEVITAPEEGIAQAKAALAARGFSVEATTAATYAGYLRHVREKGITGQALLPLCGAGSNDD